MRMIFRASFLSMIVGLLVLSVAIGTPASTQVELAYDDGTPEDWLSCPIGAQFAVKFSLPVGWTHAKILTARYYVYSYPTTFKVHVYNSGKTNLITPFSVAPTATGWFDVPLNVDVYGDFYVAIEYQINAKPEIGYDTSAPDSKSYLITAPPPIWILYSSGDFMIRAVVEQVGAPPTVPEFSLPMPVTTSIAMTICLVYLAIRKRIGRKLE